MILALEVRLDSFFYFVVFAILCLFKVSGFQ